MAEHFNSHAPCGARPLARKHSERSKKFQLTRPLRGATHALRGIIQIQGISTHTPLAGRDVKILYTLPSHRLNQGVDKNFGYSVSFIFSVI